MAPKITIKKNYILAEPQENEYWEFWEAVGRMIKMPEYPYMNVIWVFPDRPIQISYEDLYKIKDFIEQNYPENATRSKTAKVVGSGLHASLAESFAKIAEDLPYEIKVFYDIESAEDWIAE